MMSRPEDRGTSFSPISVLFVFVVQGAAVEYVDPTCSATFPGIDELKRELADWKWVYGKTPKFNLQREFLNLEGREPM